jgi:hypothetical protein
MRSIAAALLLAASTAQASVITVQFESLPISTTDNYTELGFRFSPNCHMHGMMEGLTTGVGIGFDQSNCGPTGEFNPNFLGPAEHQVTSSTPHFPGAYLYIDRAGQAFDLLGFDLVLPGWSMTASNGSFWHMYDDPATASGPDWTGIEWLLLSTEAGAPVGFDNLTALVPSESASAFAAVSAASVPLPGTLALLALGVIGAGVRKKAHHCR